MVWRWRIFALIVSLTIFLSALVVVGGQAYAKPTDGGGGTPSGGSSGGDGGGPGGDTSPGGSSGGGSSGGDSPSGGGNLSGGDIPSTGDTNPSGTQSGGDLSGGLTKDTATVNDSTSSPTLDSTTSSTPASSDNTALSSPTTSDLEDAATNSSLPITLRSDSDAASSPTSGLANDTTSDVSPSSDNTLPNYTTATEPVTTATDGPVVNEVTGDAKPPIEGATQSAEPAANELGTLDEAVGDASGLLVAPVKETTDTVGGVAEPVLTPLKDVADAVGSGAEPVLAPIEDAAGTVGSIAEPLLTPVKDVADTAGDVAEPLLAPIEDAVDTVGGIAEPLLATIEDVADIVGDVVEPVSSNLTEPVRNLTESVSDVISNLVPNPALLEPHTGAPAAALTVPSPFDPLPAEGVVPLISDDQPFWLPLFGENPAGAASTLGANAPRASPLLATSTTTVVEPGPATAARANLEGFATSSRSAGAEQRSSVSTATLLSSSSYLERLLGRSLIDGVLGLFDGIEGALNQGLQSFPAGALPAAGSLSSGSVSSGFGGAVLALLAILLLSGKYSWSVPEFLRPNSALRLAIERPG